MLVASCEAIGGGLTPEENQPAGGGVAVSRAAPRFDIGIERPEIAALAGAAMTFAAVASDDVRPFARARTGATSMLAERLHSVARCNSPVRASRPIAGANRGRRLAVELNWTRRRAEFRRSSAA